ncbi:hypothetical protein Tco_1048025, partial [Tanacetum coccineum]
MSTPVFDPYEAIKQPYLVKTETPESPYIVSSATPLIDSTPPTRDAEDSVDSDMSGARPTSSYFTTPLSPDHPLTHTTPTLVWFLRKTACMAVRVPPAMSPDLSVSIAKVAAMSDSAFCKRFRSSYESSPSSSPLDIPLRMEEDEEEEGEEVEESSDSDSKSEDAEDEGLAAEDEGPAIGDEDLAAGDEGPSMRGESLGFGGDQAVLEGQGSGSVPEPERPERVSALRQPTLTTWID